MNQQEIGHYWSTLRSELFIDFPQPSPLLQKSETGVILSIDVKCHESHFPQLCIKLNLGHVCLKPQRGAHSPVWEDYLAMKGKSRCAEWSVKAERSRYNERNSEDGLGPSA